MHRLVPLVQMRLPMRNRIGCALATKQHQQQRAQFVVASQQPMATDLRTLISALYIITDLERIADHAEGIARINIMLGDNSELPRQLGYIPKMGELSTTMLRDSLKAYIDSDIDEARRICEADDEVDRLQDAVYADAFKSMIDDNSTIQDNTYRLWTAHNLERIADRCTNICERIIFIVTGSMSEAARDVSKY